MKLKIDPLPCDAYRTADLLDVVLAQCALAAICERQSKPDLAKLVWQIPDDQYLRRIEIERRMRRASK